MSRASEYFFLASVSHTVAQLVTSLPVPEVVGMAMIGVRPSASPPMPVSRKRRTRSKSPAAAASTFAASITEPPPRATIASTGCEAAA